MQTELSHDADAQRYALRSGDTLISALDYRVNGDAVSFTHTFTNPSYRGRGHAGEVVAFAVDDVESRTSLRIVPMCWYVAEWFDAHPERKGLLSRESTPPV